MSAYKTLSNLRAVCEIERLTVSAEAAAAETEHYDNRASVGMADFATFVEPVLAQRCALLSLELGGGGGQQPRRRPPQGDLVEQSLRYAEACRANGLHQLALNRLAGLKELKQLSEADTARYDDPSLL